MDGPAPRERNCRTSTAQADENNRPAARADVRSVPLNFPVTPYNFPHAPQQYSNEKHAATDRGQGLPPHAAAHEAHQPARGRNDACEHEEPIPIERRVIAEGAPPPVVQFHDRRVPGSGPPNTVAIRALDGTPAIPDPACSGDGTGLDDQVVG